MKWLPRSVAFAHRSVVHSRRVRVLAEHFADLIPQGASVLDIGCGDGLLDSLLQQHRPDLCITGVDVLVRSDAHIPVVPFDGIHLPFVDDSFDAVMFCDVLHHTDNPLPVLREAVRVATRCVVLKDHVVEGFLARQTLCVMDFLGNAPHGVALHYNYLTRLQWRTLFEELGLNPIEFREQLKMYPGWADRWFGRSLHFIASCAVPRESSLDGRNA